MQVRHDRLVGQSGRGCGEQSYSRSRTTSKLDAADIGVLAVELEEADEKDDLELRVRGQRIPLVRRATSGSNLVVPTAQAEDHMFKISCCQDVHSQLDTPHWFSTSRPAHIFGGWMRFTPRFPKTPWEILKIHEISLIFHENPSKSMKNHGFSRFPKVSWEIWV